MELEHIEDMIKERNITLIKDDIPINNLKGLHFDNVIVYDTSLTTSAEKKCIIAEELGHYETSSRINLDYKDILSQKEERRARGWAADKLIAFDQIIKASSEGIRNRFELAEYLNVTEEFLIETLEFWQQKYGNYITYKDKKIILNPLMVMNDF